MVVTVSDALSSLGADLTLAISLSISRELLDAAAEEQLQQTELVGIVLALTVILSALPMVFEGARNEVARLWGAGVARDCNEELASTHATNDIGAFCALFVRVAQRISASTSVQLVAQTVTTTQPLRSVRLLSLASVTVFFVFVETTATLGRRHGRL